MQDQGEPVNSCRLVEVIPGLWIGPLASVTEIRKIRRQWTIVSVLSSEKLSGFIQRSLQELKQQQDGVAVSHIEWKLKDQARESLISTRLEEILQHMDQSLLEEHQTDPPKACLVHCAFGISRSVAVCAAWLLSRRRCSTLADALECIRRVRPEAMPNMGFLAGLRALEQTDGNVQAAIERMSRHNRKA